MKIQIWLKYNFLATLVSVLITTSKAQDCQSTESATLLQPEEILSTLQDLDETKHERLKVEDEKLKIIAAGQGYGWFSESKGPLLFELVGGDFLIETEVQIKRKNGKKGLPKGNYSSAGLLIRNPSSSRGNETWIMYNVGVQNTFYGNEIKVTRPLSGHQKENTMYYLGMHSLSTLFLIPQENKERLKMRMAKVGNEVRCYFKEGEQWREQKPDGKMEILGNGIKVPVHQFDETQFRPNKLEFEDCLQALSLIHI